MDTIPLPIVVPPIAIDPPDDVTEAADPIAIPLELKQTAGAPIAMVLDPVQDAAYPIAIDFSVSEVV
jgi:hypothetical protein